MDLRSLNVVTLPGDWRIGLHAHEFVEFTLVVSGQFEVSWPGATAVCGPGASHLHPYGSPHAYRRLGGQPATLIWLWLSSPAAMPGPSSGFDHRDQLR